MIGLRIRMICKLLDFLLATITSNRIPWLINISYFVWLNLFVCLQVLFVLAFAGNAMHWLLFCFDFAQFRSLFISPRVVRLSVCALMLIYHAYQQFKWKARFDCILFFRLFFHHLIRILFWAIGGAANESELCIYVQQCGHIQNLFMTYITFRPKKTEWKERDEIEQNTRLSCHIAARLYLNEMNHTFPVSELTLTGSVTT